MKSKLAAVFIILASFIVSFSVYADQTIISDYPEARDIFWEQVYPYGAWTLYCGVRFFDRGGSIDGRPLSIEHVYPQSWMAEHQGCESVSDCEETNERFNHMASDLHNLYPALRNVNSSRGNAPFGIIEGEDWRYEDCDYERAEGLAEPRPSARGNIARSIFYMHQEYELPIDSGLLELLRQWNQEDSPSCHEMRRNNTIEELQNTRNRFIDHPRLADDL